MSHNIDNLGHGKVSRLVNRLRSRSDKTSHQMLVNNTCSLYPPPGSSSVSPERVSTSQYDSSTPEEIGQSSSLRSLLSSSSIIRHKSSNSRPQPTFSNATTSLTLWTEAYDYLCDAPATAQLVVAYEGIVCQELPDHLKMGMGMSMTFRDHPGSKRIELIETIAAAGLSKRRGCTGRNSDDDDETRRLIDVGKDLVADVGGVYGPAAAVAWCGFCTLTPLLLNALIQRHADFRRGIQHMIGRIRWYMLLDHLLDPQLWESLSAFEARRTETKDTLLRVYRKVLEFQMNVVCATASAWNRAAKNVVERSTMRELIQGLEDMNLELRELISTELVGAWRKRLGKEDESLNTEMGGWL